MGYIAINETTKQAFYSKGANKLADKIGCNPSTITKSLKKFGENKIIKGFTVTKCFDLSNNDRGLNIKSVFNGNKSY